MNYTLRDWNLNGKLVALKLDYDDYFKVKTWVVKVFGEDFSETRLFKSRNAAMNFIRKLKRNLTENVI